MFTRFLQKEPWPIQDPFLGTNFLAVFPGPFRASASPRDCCWNSKCSCPVRNQPWQCHGRSMRTHLQLYNWWSDHSFPAADLVLIGTSDFHLDSENNGERLTWLPNVSGPRLFADTNGQYHDEAVRSLDCFCDEAASSGSADDLITPGRFEFELSRRSGVLILSAEDQATTRHHQQVGFSLAGLLQQNTSAPLSPAARESTAVNVQHPSVA